MNSQGQEPSSNSMGGVHEEELLQFYQISTSY
jgi:hypothetical protein